MTAQQWKDAVWTAWRANDQTELMRLRDLIDREPIDAEPPPDAPQVRRIMLYGATWEEPTWAVIFEGAVYSFGDDDGGRESAYQVAQEEPEQIRRYIPTTVSWREIADCDQINAEVDHA